MVSLKSKTCPRGHRYSKKRYKGGRNGTMRRCLVCGAERERLRRRENRIKPFDWHTELRRDI